MLKVEQVPPTQGLLQLHCGQGMDAGRCLGGLDKGNV